MKTQTLPLDKNWWWKQRESSKPVLDELGYDAWSPTKAFPSEIHVELLKAGKIPDPYLGFNEHKVQGIAEQEWLYKTSFDCQILANTDSVLEFQGLDTFCDVYLNGTKILESDNQFRTYVVSVSPSKGNNTMLLHFKPAKLIAKSLEAQFGAVRAGSANLGDPSRVYVRKAQYDWRWDWGPELMTVGPYRSISLISYSTRITDFYARAYLSNEINAPKKSLEVDVSLQGLAGKSIKITLSDVQGKTLRSEEVTLGSGTSNDDDKSTTDFKSVVSWTFDEQSGIQSWWPVGYGRQTLYNVEVALLGDDSQIIDTKPQRVGFRSVRLVQEALKEPDMHGTGTNFLFEVNGVRMFIGGSNWIPADNFLTTIDDERYREWLTLLRDGNQNMVRLWGGGVYEPDVFYDICDELGILVWQDFQFACGVYPAHDSFLESVRKEAVDNVKRLRHHPSMALFCGNNEDYQQVLQWGGITDLPARKIYEELLPSIVSKLTSPEIPYHRGSPYGGKGWDTTDPTIGDIHQWDVWAGKEKAYQDYDIMGGRFVSEFGIPSFPDMRTVEYWLTGVGPEQRYSQSKIMAQHTRAGAFEHRFAVVMNDNFRLTSDLETHVYNTQIMQSEAVSFAYQAWRRAWRGPGKEYTAGALVWQLNDCWPVTSWAIADYFRRPKPVYFSIARQLKPITVNIFRTVTKNKTNDRPRQFYEFGAFQSIDAKIEIWGTNSTLQTRQAQLELQCVDLESDWRYTETHQVSLLPNQSTELLSIPCPSPPHNDTSNPDATTSYSVVVAARLLCLQTGDVLSRFSDWPQPFRFLRFPDPALDIQISKDQLTVKAKRPVKGLVFSVDDNKDQTETEVKWSDNAIDVMPGDVQTIVARGLGARKIKVAYMGKEAASAV
ncbi:glycoside hydrolase family 2 protein [Hygrophoropsis aurantiaca]|uniref:Glycoside hydrolase family 2 protein n=1 Tax=Hygrophoropsis aurantiaca TaxID=72124 RepID=A0ACB8AJE6_9AGAM|nr:glycoside hydrolase family 2 protein [Hygrophoropsis aurantiaca]